MSRQINGRKGRDNLGKKLSPGRVSRHARDLVCAHGEPLEKVSDSLDLYFPSRAKQYRPERPFVVKEDRPGCLTIRLSSEAIQKLGLVGGLDYAVQSLDGNTLVIHFIRKGASP